MALAARAIWLAQSMAGRYWRFLGERRTGWRSWPATRNSSSTFASVSGTPGTTRDARSTRGPNQRSTTPPAGTSAPLRTSDSARRTCSSGRPTSRAIRYTSASVSSDPDASLSRAANSLALRMMSVELLAGEPLARVAVHAASAGVRHRPQRASTTTAPPWPPPMHAEPRA